MDDYLQGSCPLLSMSYGGSSSFKLGSKERGMSVPVEKEPLMGGSSSGSGLQDGVINYGTRDSMGGSNKKGVR